MAAARVQKANSVCYRFLSKYRTAQSISYFRALCTVTNAVVDESKGKNTKSLYEVYHEKKIKETARKPTLGPAVKDFETRLEEERKKVVIKDLNLELKKMEWKESSVRAGAVGVKIGMSWLWRKDGKKVKVSLIQLKDCEVMDSRLGRNDGGNNHHNEVIIGAVNEDRLHKVSEKAYGEYVKYGISPKRRLHGFQVTKDALLPSGTQIDAMHFCAGQYLRVTGISQDLGFQGVMKRWGMKGQPASHGQTKTHRKMGASGGGGTPGRVFPGKRMAGHMGGNRMVLPSVMLYRINTKYNVLYLGGQVPGAVGDFIKIQDSRVRKAKFKTPPPFPTYIPDTDNPLSEDIYSEHVHPSTAESFTFSGDQ